MLNRFYKKSLPKKKVKVNDSPEINLIWIKAQYYFKVSEILKHRKYTEVRSSLTQQPVAFFLNIFFFFLVKCKVISLFFRCCESILHIIIANISICNCIAEYAKQKTSKNYKYTYYDSLLRISLLQRLCMQFFLDHLQNLSEACWMISLNSIRNRPHLKNE